MRDGVPLVTCDARALSERKARAILEFAPNPDWSHRFSPGGEIQAYFEGVARRYEVEKRICFGEEVARCEHANGRWQLATTSTS